MRILVVEDNPELADIISRGLKDAGFESDWVADVATARDSLNATRYAALILDLGLPDGDGLLVLRELRSRNDPIPVLVLTARGGVQDRISGLRTGADDYLVKPFAFEELVARIEALLRRPDQLLGRSLSLSNMVLDTEGKQLLVDGQPRILFGREFEVMEMLLRRKGSVVSRKIMEDQIFGLSGEVGSNAVEVYVHRVRRQLAAMNARVKILNVRGVGYILTEDS
ncbi:response regulator transcription factor [Rhodopseudomonas boonkerdii]|uniref:response regulator transcription factor n=1 Tax=Rhodopseudomonas boonkerdii TaxID=475937 RepID=UPI001E4A4784|nr:response regulator transcription factor [Rhodopseudomonas boonkerdii]UGV26806.1 response regulator transcription factor [Rhodopseudomonas boonkerdii]